MYIIVLSILVVIIIVLFLISRQIKSDLTHHITIFNSQILDLYKHNSKIRKDIWTLKNPPKYDDIGKKYNFLFGGRKIKNYTLLKFCVCEYEGSFIWRYDFRNNRSKTEATFLVNERGEFL